MRNKEEHKKYLKDMSDIADKILLSEEDTKKFLVDAKINTPSGKLTKIYKSQTRPK